MLLVLCLPVDAPLWMPVIGTFFAIVIVKQLYGGIGKNFVNPALAGRAFLFFVLDGVTMTKLGDTQGSRRACPSRPLTASPWLLR